MTESEGRTPVVTGPFIRAADLLERLDEVVLCDLRWSVDGRLGRQQHLEGSLPGAVFVDLDTEVSGPPTEEGGRHPLPDPAAFAAAMGRLGIPDDVPVVAYDQGPGVIAARLVWMLRAIGQPAAVLDGGFAAWPGPVTAGGAVRAPVEREVRDWPPSLVVDTDRVAALAREGSGVLLDARDAARYRGEVDEPGGAPAGHIPGAQSLPGSAHLDDGRLRPHAELRALYEPTGALERGEVVAYCGSGVSACMDLLALEELGVVGKLYPGSWSAWSADPTRPVATGNQ